MRRTMAVKDSKKNKNKKYKEHDPEKYIELEPTSDEVKSGTGIAEELLDERAKLSLSQRRARGRVMKRYKSKIAAARKRASRRRASPEKLKKRAQKRALNVIRQRLSKNKKYSEMSPSEKIALDARLSKVSKSAINRIARRELPKVRQAEMERFRKRSMREDLNTLFEAYISEKEDPDIGHMKGSQPAGYYRGVNKSVKDDRARHFKKYGKMDDDNPAAYKPAPGDKEAKTKTSKHTKKFKQIFGEALVTECYAEQYSYLDEGLRDILDKFIGLDRKKIQKVVDGLSKQELMTIVRSASPRSARRVLGPKDYAYWDAAYQRLKTMNEASFKDMVTKKRPHMGLNKNGSVKIDRRFKMFRKTMDENQEDLVKQILELEESVEDLFESPKKAIKDKAEKSGIPYSILKDVYDRGVAAWRTGHRPGTTPSQWGIARVNSFATKSSGTWGKADKDLADRARKAMKEELFTLDEQFELKFLDEQSIIDKALEKIHKYVLQGTELGDIAYQISRARGVNTSSRELEKKYIEKYGKPVAKGVSPAAASVLRRKYGFAESKQSQFTHKLITTLNFDICPSAKAAFDKNAQQGIDDKSKFVDAVKAVDRYLGIEKDLKLKDTVTQDDLDTMTDAVDAAKEEIKEAGLKGHDYHQIHIDAVKDMMSKDVKENVATERAKARIKAEKQRDARKHDRMLDRAKMRDLSTKLKSEQSESPDDREWGTDSLTKTYKKDTPGEDLEEQSAYNNNFKRGSRVRFNVEKITGENYSTEGTVVGTDPETMRLRVRDDDKMLHIVKHEDASLM